MNPIHHQKPIWGFSGLLIIALFFSLGSFVYSSLANAEEIAVLSSVKDVKLETKVQFIETDDSTCVVNDGKLISIALINPAESYEVWVDRWYMQVQTADHTKQLLTPEHASAELGCSRTYSGPQHWTLYSVKSIQ